MSRKKIINPENGRLVYEDGIIGRKLLKEMTKTQTQTQTHKIDSIIDKLQTLDIKKINDDDDKDIIDISKTMEKLDLEKEKKEKDLYKQIINNLEKKSYCGSIGFIGYKSEEEYKKIQLTDNYKTNKRKIEAIFANYEKQTRTFEPIVMTNEQKKQFREVKVEDGLIMKMDDYLNIMKPTIIKNNSVYSYSSVDEFNKLYKNFRLDQRDEIDTKIKFMEIDSSSY